MATSIQRPRPIIEHPVTRRRYVIPTPSINDLYQRVKSSVIFLRTGDLFWGETGFGKTSAIHFVQKNLEIDFPRIVTIKVLCHKSKSHSEDAFFANFLNCVGHTNPNAGTIAKKRHRLKHFLLDRVQRSRRAVIVMFADEAQRMGVLEFEWFRDVYDEIDDAGVRPLMFPVGQRALLAQRNSFRDSQDTQIIGRFMTRDHAFRGLTNVDHVATCLAGYDNNFYPENSDWSYSRFFFPRSWQDGMRLQDSAISLWDAFYEAHHNAGFTTEVEIPMKYFSLAVGIALLKYSEQDADDFRLTPAMWRDAVLESDYVKAQEMIRLSLAGVDIDDNDELSVH